MMMKSICRLLCCVICHAAVAQSITPQPDAAFGGGAGPAADGDCKCTSKSFSEELIVSFVPIVDNRVVSPGGKPARPLTWWDDDEWGGDDELYRIADATTVDHTFRVQVLQNFEIVDDLWGSDTGFPANHEHPRVELLGIYTWRSTRSILSKTERNDEVVGIIVDGVLTGAMTASVSGSVSTHALYGPAADTSVSGSAIMKAWHPCACKSQNPDGTPKPIVDETIEISASAGTDTKVSTSMTIRVNQKTEAAAKVSEDREGPLAQGEYRASSEAEAAFTLGSIVQLTNTSFSASIVRAPGAAVYAQTDEPKLDLRVQLVSHVGGAGNADGATAKGGGSFISSATFGGDWKLCGMREMPSTGPSGIEWPPLYPTFPSYPDAGF